MRAPVTAIQEGLDYQALWFWIKACGLFRPGASLGRVGYEVGTYKAFDDVVCEYVETIPDGRGGEADGHCWSVKYSTTFEKSITAADLTDPALINATKISLLERLRDAVLANAAAEKRHLFGIVAPWGIEPSDPLCKLVSTNDGSLRIDVLFDGTGQKGAMGALRERWRALLGFGSEEELIPIISRLRIAPWVQTFEQHVSELNIRLASCGFVEIPPTKRVFPYFKLIEKLRGEGIQWFDAQALQHACVRESLLASSVTVAPKATKLGIRSFLRFTENLEEETDRYLCLVEHFEGRLVRSPDLWADAVTPSVHQFLADNVRSGGKYELHLHCLASIAFLVGHLIEPKLGVAVSVCQRQYGRPPQIWTAERTRPGETVQPLRITSATIGSGSGVALAVGLTNPIGQDVAEYCKQNCPAVGRIMIAEPDGGPSQRAVSSGYQAFTWAEQLKSDIQRFRTNPRCEIHVIWSAPNTFAFFLGQVFRSVGECQLYEFDFDGERRYTPSMRISAELRLGH